MLSWGGVETGPNERVACGRKVPASSRRPARSGQGNGDGATLMRRPAA